MEDNNQNINNDKGKVMVLISLIIAVSIVLVFFVFLAILDITHKDTKSKLSTTTRRTIKEEENTTTNSEVTEPITENSTTTVSTTQVASSNSTRPSTTRKTTTKVVTTVVEEETDTVIPSHDYEIVYDKTTYPDALDSWEWEVINLINQERRKNGLSELLVARELRNMAEEAAYMYYASGSSAIKPYLSGYSYLYMHSNLDIDANTLYESTLNSTKITTNPDIKYVGAGVLVKNITLDTYFYVIVYEYVGDNMFEYMGDRLSNAIKNIKGMGRITEENIGDAMREIRMALLEADVNYEVVKEFIKNVKEKALGLEVEKNLKPEELFIKLVKDELVSLLGGDYVALEVGKMPTIIMMVGLQGSGKTTTSGKIANLVRKKNKKNPLLVACDVYRPAAIDQLCEIGASLNIPVFEKGKEKPLEIVKEALVYAKENKHDFIIIDTAGRLHIDEELMDELVSIEEYAKPNEILLVIDAMMGQDAINVIKGFNDKLGLTGAILTKMDGNTKGGVALSVRHLTNVPIKFIGDSEKLDGLSEFYPERMAERILDMGDILSIAEKVEGIVSEEEASNMAKKMKKGDYTLEDFLTNLKQIKKLGPLENILKMLPGARKMGLGDININPKDMAHVEAIILSMTPYEREHPEVLKNSRKVRISKGSGRSVEEINRLLKQFEQMKMMMKQVSNGNMKMPF